MTRVIAYAGRKGSGKSTAASHMAKKLSAPVVKFAGPLKEMMRAFFRDCGLSEKEIERRIEGDLKETPDPLRCGKTPRHAMQTLGTEWGRDLIGEDVWVNAYSAKVDSLGCEVVVTDDLRFENEERIVNLYPNIIVEVIAPWVVASGGSEHVSEAYRPTPTVSVMNSTAGNLEAFLQSIESFR